MHGQSGGDTDLPGAQTTARNAGRVVSAGLARLFHTLLRSAGFQACCVADFQVGGPSKSLARPQVRNLRYSRLGSLCYKSAADFGAHACEISWPGSFLHAKKSHPDDVARPRETA